MKKFLDILGPNHQNNLSLNGPETLSTKKGPWEGKWILNPPIRPWEILDH